MYLRKSQLDRDFEDVSVEETLKRHEKTLTEFCINNNLNVDLVLKEVVSGESITSRPQMMKLLELINTGKYAGVICMDIDRLSRGSSMDWLDLLAIQGTLKSLLQHHSSKASILQCLAFFIVQLSHPYMTTGKIIALTRWTFAGKIMSLLFNTQSMFVIAFL